LPRTLVIHHTQDSCRSTLPAGVDPFVKWSAGRARVVCKLSENVRVVGSRGRLTQVLVNLIRNAIEAMEGSQNRDLVISTRPADDDMLTISVADTGHGIAPEMSAQLFQPFVTTKRHGMGVGLSISRTIVEAHGGQIGAEPNPIGGTVFCFTLRAVTNEEIGDAS